jgi:low affinity Fe/Cu permease
MMSAAMPRLGNETQPAPAVRSASVRFLSAAAKVAGSQRTFTVSLLLIAAWAATGPLFHYSNSWQLAMNTRTAILRFFMILLIQHTQNRASTAVHTKLDELIRANQESRDIYVGLEQRSDESLRHLTRSHPGAAYADVERIKG